jgi:hypothetical protein
MKMLHKAIPFAWISNSTVAFDGAWAKTRKDAVPACCEIGLGAGLLMTWKERCVKRWLTEER